MEIFCQFCCKNRGSIKFNKNQKPYFLIKSCKNNNLYEFIFNEKITKTFFLFFSIIEITNNNKINLYKI